MAGCDAMPAEDARLIEEVKTWLPTDDAAAHSSIVDLLRLVARAGVDPIPALRAALPRWFGPAARALLPPRIAAGRATPSRLELVALEPLPPLRRPTLWPQRPKRFADELFSSWLWRTSVAAGAPPHRFAAEVLAMRYGDPDTEVPGTTLHRLASRSGQSVPLLACGTLMAAHPMTRGDVVLNALLRHGGFLLCSRPRGGRSRAILQYCPRCLATDPHPYVRRRWRFAIETVCVRHRCSLHDACWRCGAFVDLLTQTRVSRQLFCAHCDAALAHAAATPTVPETLCGQRGVICVLYCAAVCIDPITLHRHLDVLVSRFPSGARVRDRQVALMYCRPSNVARWFGPITDPHHYNLIQQHARGTAYDTWFGPARWWTVTGRPRRAAYGTSPASTPEVPALPVPLWQDEEPNKLFGRVALTRRLPGGRRASSGASS
jgi:hypothetical protein